MVTVQKIFILLVLSSIFYAKAHFTIEIEPTELQSIGQVLVESYFHHNLIQRQPTVVNNVFSQIKKFSLSTLQLLGITASFIGANILTPLLQEKFQFALTTTVANTTQHTNNTNDPSKICQHDFGCDRNICWRSCRKSEKENDRFSWCYTKSSLDTHKYAHCHNA